MPENRSWREEYESDEARTKTTLVKLFRQIDKDESGYIEQDELLTALSKRGFVASKEHGQRALAAVDQNKDGRVSFQEFELAFRPLVVLSQEERNGKKRWWRRKRHTKETLDRLLLEWKGLGEHVSIGSDLDLVVPPTPTDQAAALPLWRFALTGALGGAIGRIVTNPLEKASMMQQISGRGVRDEFRRVAIAVEEGGIRSLWSGAGWNGFRVALFGGFSAAATTQLLLWFPVPEYHSNGGYHWSEPAWRGGVGAVAGLFATIVTHPLEVIRTRVTLNDVQMTRSHEAIAESENPIETIRAIMSTGGTRALWRGILPACLGIVPFAAAQHSLYDLSKHTVAHYVEPSVPLYVGCGVAAGMAAQTLVYPLEVIRRRQIEVGVIGSKVNYSMKSAFRAVLRDGGVRGLWAGIVPTYLRVAPCVVISLLVRNNLIGRLDGK